MPDWDALASRFDSPGVRAIFLLGSHARGDAGPFSDIDLARLVTDKSDLQPADGSYFIDEQLVVVSSYDAVQVEEWFTRPEVAVGIVVGLRSAVPLLDREGAFAHIQARARAFTWDEAMREKAQAWVSEEMVGWIEEVHKGLAGLLILRRAAARLDASEGTALLSAVRASQAGIVGRLLHARFGCTWGLTRVMSVFTGRCLTSDSTFYTETADAVGQDSEWVRLRRIAFGIEGAQGPAPSLCEQVVAGLRLYVLTAELVRDALRPQDAPAVWATVELIQDTLGAESPA